MPLPFNKTLDLKLIKLVKDNPIIYNSTHPKHLDFDAREVVWQKIGDALSRPAVEFAGIQCQVHFGDFQEDKHKPGFFENLNEYLPEQYSSAWGVEKKILREFAKYQGLSQLEAKHQYTKTARDLPTYGVTFFLVKEKMKGKKKLVPRLLGINAESILRLDETTKEILQVWPLTQVKTYHAGKAETFTLDFGDYSDKEYSVKTNDAYRIRDILQGYIDIIRKRMEANYNLQHTEHYAICEDHVNADRGHIMTHIEHNSSKVVEESFVGPSKIITYEPGTAIAQGTQIMTVQQMVVTSKGGNQQTVVVGEVPMRKDMSLDFVRKLNRLNSNSVKIVTLLTDPSEHNLSEAAKIIDSMVADMPSITEGVKQTADKKTSDEAKRKLLRELQELRECMTALVQSTNVQHNPEEAQDAAKRIADLSTQMFFSLDPAMQKRGKFCRDSRKSFIQDDAVDASLRRASYLAAAAGVCATVQGARGELDQEYHGPLLGAADAEELRRAAADKMDKLNAAVALYLTAYADPKNINYSAAVTSINTMNELLPELVKDGKALSSVEDGKNREELLDAIRSLCDAMKNVCLAADPDDHQKINDEVKEYSKRSEKLVFAFRRGGGVDKQNEIIELSKVAGEKASLLLIKVNELTGLVPDADATMLDDAGVRCADAAQDLITCATLTAPSIHEPHCQSALTAAAESLSSSAQLLACTWKPLVEDPARKAFGEDLRDRTMDLAKALDKLKGAFAGLDGVEGPDEVRANRRLRFVTTVADAKNKMNAVEAELDTPAAHAPQPQPEEELRRRLARGVAQLHAALAALVAAAADRDKPDYKTAEIAVSTIGELMPEIVKDGKLLSANAGDDAREQMLAELRALCDSTRAVYYSVENGDMDNLNKLASKVGASSGRLYFKFNPHSGRGQEQQILDLASSANEKASQLLGEVEDVVRKIDGQTGTELETARLKAADAAGVLQTAAQLTAPCIQDPRCQACLVSSASALSASSQRLAAAWAPLPPSQEGNKLEELRLQLERALDALKKAVQDTGIGEAELPGAAGGTPRLRFVAAAAAARDNVKAARAEIDQPAAPAQPQPEEELRRRLARGVAQLHAALAALVAAAAGGELQHAAAGHAVAAAAEAVPAIVRDGKLLSAGKDDRVGEEMRTQLRALCDHAATICGSSETGDLDDLNRLASTLAASSGKLLFTFKPTAGGGKEQQILDISSSANDKASQLLAGVQELAQQVHGQPRIELDAARLKAADAAQRLHTTAQLTAPCLPDPRCQATLVSSANALSSSSQQLASHWTPLVKEPRLAHLAKSLEDQRLQLERELARLKKACVDTDVQPSEELHQGRELQRLQFLKSVAAAENQLQAAEKELKKPTVPPKLQGLSSEPAAPRLRAARAALHAALAALAHAHRDRENPDYAASDKAINDINRLLPQIVKEVRSQNLDEKARSATLEDLKAMCEAARGLLAAANADQDLNNSAVKLATASGKLLDSYDTPAEQDREQRILDLSSTACQKASLLLSGVHQLAAEAGGEAGGRLDSTGSQLADRANSLLTTAQITAPCFEDPECQSILQSSTESVQEASQRLASTWKPLVQDPRFLTLGADLERARQELQKELEELKKACQLDSGAKLPIRKAPPVPPKRTTSHEAPKCHAHADLQVKRDFNQEFLDQMRLDETRAGSEAALAAETLKNRKAQKELRQQLVLAVDSAVHDIQKAEDHITKEYSSPGAAAPAASLELALVLQKQLEFRLAAAARAAAQLLASDQSDLDYAAAAKATTALSEQMPKIAQDAKLLRGAMSEGERKQFLEDVLAMFQAAKVLLGAAKNDHKRINESAIAFGNKSAKLLYVVSTDIDPAQENEVLSLTRSIGDGAARLCARGEASPLPAAAAAAAALADVAGTLLYSAKLLAPTVHIPECSQSLIHASEDVTQKLRKYTSTIETLDKVDPQTSAVFNSESKKLEGLLGSLQEDLRTGKLVKRRVVERIVVEDTPLRQLVCRILEDAKRRAEQTSCPEDQRRRWAAHANDLAKALLVLDRAYHASRKAPADGSKHLALENAVQELQLLVLTRRPAQAAAQNHIVDLTDYVRAVSEDANKLLKKCNEGQPELQMVKEHCEKIYDNAARIMNPYLQSSGDAPDDDRGEVAQFAEDCEKRIRTINSIIQNGKTKIEVHEKAARLEESTNLLKFATESDAATTSGVGLDAAREELGDLRTALGDMLAGGKPARKGVPWSDTGSDRLIAAASRRGTGSRALAPAFAVYLDDIRANRDLSDQDQRKRAKEHLGKLLKLLKTLTMASSRHVATWQHTNHPEIADITEQVIKELDNYRTECNGNQKSVLSEVDINALLRPNTTKVQIEQEQVAEKLNQAASKLSSSAGMILQSVQRPASLARSLHAAAAAAAQLAAVAAARPHDIAHSQKIDEASKEICLQTYNVLKTAEFTSQDPNNIASRRKLMDACRLLNDAITQLVKTSLPVRPLQQVCAEALQRLQLQQSSLLAPHAAAAAGYGDTLLALASQRDVIQKLCDDTPTPRAQFCRSLSHAAGAVARAADCAAHAAYLLSISDQHKDLATAGFADAPRIQSLSEAVQDSCHRIISSEIELAEEEAPILTKHVQDFQQAVAEAQDKLKDTEKEELKEYSSELEEAVKQLNAVVRETVLNKSKLTAAAIRVVDAARAAAGCVRRAARAPGAAAAPAGAQAGSDDVIRNCRNLNTKMMSLIREVRAAEDQELMTWVTFGSSRKEVLEMYEALLSSVRVNGERAGVIESLSDSEEEVNQTKKTFVQIQLDAASRWLRGPAGARGDAGAQAARTILGLAEKVSEDLKGHEKEEMEHLVTETQQLLAECQNKRDHDKASLLMERLKTLKKAIERGMVSMVVEDFMEGEEPLADLEILADAEKDEDKRKFLLERKIAELLAHLGRVTRTARVVAGAGRGGDGASGRLQQASRQTELLAPMLVQAAQKRVVSPDDKAAIEHYQKLLAEYAEQLAHMRELCDQAVDPMDFVQTAGETMQRMREDKTCDNNPQMCAYASTAITKLANRVINVSMSSSDVRKDPELQKALREAKERLKAAVPKPNDRPSRILDWKVTTAEILRTTGEVESVLGGEMIFKKQQTSDQPIFAAALDLHTAIRSWSARDNEIVAVAKRMAVLMAKLSDFMNTDRKRDVIFTAKSIVTESHEVADLARKLANECTDVRIKTNLLKVCERIPTISGQLKMLATVKGSLGQQDLKEDQEDMNMLVGNAQNLMLSVQEAVNAAASASVKINSQRGQPRMRWVRNTYY